MRLVLISLAIIGALAVFLAVIFATGVARIAWDGGHAIQPEAPNGSPVAAEDSPGTSGLPSTVPSAEAPMPAAPDVALAARPPAERIAQAPIMPKDQPAAAAELHAAKDGGANEINDPDGERVLGALDNGTHLRLMGRVGTLKIMGVNGRSVLDASGLTAKRVILVGDVNGSSTVKLFAPGGTIRVQAGVNGQSNIDLDAPGGEVVFARGGQSGAGVINGESNVSITSRLVDFQSSINGTETKIAVTLSRGGEIKVHDLQGASRLTYKKAGASDPEPTIEAGLSAPAARLVRAD